MANYKIIKDLLPNTDKRTFGKMTPKTVVIHNTAMPASAKNEATYVKSGGGGVTYHYAVDDKEAIQLLPLDKSGWHCGDGGTTIGGKNGIAIEICYSKNGGPKFDKAEDNAAHLAAKLLHQFNLGMAGLSKHQDWALDKKYCPHRTLDKGWARFVKMVKNYYDAMGYKTSTPIANQKPTVSVSQMQEWARIKGASSEFIGLAKTFYDVAIGRGLDPALLYAQSAKETAFGNFGGVLDASFNNPCGMKTTQGGGNYDPKAHTRFKNWEQGIKAQADHLNLYAGAEGYPMADSPDPRHFPSIKGTARTVEELGGKWAGASNYGTSIVDRMVEMRGIKTKEVSKVKDSQDTPRYKYAIAYVNDGDLANAQALLNVMPTNTILIRTNDARDLKVDKVIQVGGSKVDGASIILAGKDRSMTLDEINRWVKANL